MSRGWQRLWRIPKLLMQNRPALSFGQAQGHPVGQPYRVRLRPAHERMRYSGTPGRERIQAQPWPGSQMIGRPWPSTTGPFGLVPSFSPFELRGVLDFIDPRAFAGSPEGEFPPCRSRRRLVYGRNSAMRSVACRRWLRVAAPRRTTRLQNTHGTEFNFCEESVPELNLAILTQSMHWDRGRKALHEQDCGKVPA